MKKTTKNPITFFREANEKRQAAVKKSLRKAQWGYAGSLPPSESMDLDNNPVGPRTEAQTNFEDPMSNGRGPRVTTPREDMLTPNYSIDPSTGKMYKKGGSVKPSAGLSKKTKSNIAKKASAGKDIGKKGKNFAKVAAAAGGGEKGKRIAAAAMWKNAKRG